MTSPYNLDITKEERYEILEQFYNRIYKAVEPFIIGDLGIDKNNKFDLALAVEELLDNIKEENEI